MRPPSPDQRWRDRPRKPMMRQPAAVVVVPIFVLAMLSIGTTALAMDAFSGDWAADLAGAIGCLLALLGGLTVVVLYILRPVVTDDD